MPHGARCTRGGPLQQSRVAAGWRLPFHARVRPRVFLLVVLAAAAAPAQDVFYSVPLDALRITEGDAAELTAGRLGWNWREPVVAVGAGARAFLDLGPVPHAWHEGGVRLLVRAPGGREVTGRVAALDGRGAARVWRFTIPADRASADHERAFQVAERDWYARLLARELPGGAWFRHRVHELSEALGEPVPATRAWGRRGDDDVFGMFTGGRALAENLQLDRAMDVREGGGEVALDELPGIEVREFDWKELTAGIAPALDPLARCVPHDQHAFFVPDLARAALLLREADQHGAPVLQAVEPRAQDEGLLRRYEDQLGIRASELAGLLGTDAGSVVLTGSDLSFRMGTDVAVLVETADPAKALANVWQHMLRSAGSAVDTGGEHEGVAFHGRSCGAWRVSRYAAALQGAFVLTNSKAQLRRLLEVQAGKVPALSTLPEYRYFRHRYARGGDETGFAILTDAAIRRWCGPRWRIAEHRRTRALARLLELTAQHATELATREVTPVDLVVPDDAVRLEEDGVVSPRWGSVRFCTPVIELVLGAATGPEAEAYGRWRDSYQRNWSQFFDPIAVRVRVDDEVLSADVSVMPLIASSDYRKTIEISLGAKIDPAALDAHPVLARLAMAIDAKSRPFQLGTRMAASMTPGLEVDPLAWMGETISLFVDESPFWQELAAAEDPDAFLQANWYRLPIGFEVAVVSPLKVTAFLAGLRTFVEDTAPGMTTWASRQHAGKGYVRIAPSADASRDLREIEEAALFYAVSGKRLLLSLDEKLIQRALERDAARAARADKNEEPPASEKLTVLGENLALHVSTAGAESLRHIGVGPAQTALQRLSFENLPILEEWKRRFPDRDPVEVHERLFGVRPVCPGGGQYLWNDELAAMESTVFGSPFAPRRGPAYPPLLQRLLSGDFGLTFDPNGLRARAMLTRK